ncbi:MAG: hypothetical protein ACRD2Y_09740 [Terriglobales bacterium]
MKRIVCASLVVFLVSVCAAASTITVTATGSCPVDPDAIQAAVSSAAPGDVIELSPGNPATEFNFTCLPAGTTAVVIGPTKIGITLAGVPSSTVIRGPGPAGLPVNFGFRVQASGVTIRDLTVRGFFEGIRIVAASGFPPPSHVTVTHSQLEGNRIGVFVRTNVDHASLTNNTVLVPAPPNSDFLGPWGTTFGLAIAPGCDDLLIAENTVVGPGRVANIQRVDDVVMDNTGQAVNLRTVGALQFDVGPPVSRLGRFSGNSFTGLDLGLQASSDAGVVTRNTVINSAVGIVISNDAEDGVTTVRDDIVALNTAAGNLIGILIHSGSGNVIALNDASGNSVAGVAFVQTADGAASQDNVFLRNKGSLANVAGNQGLAVPDLVP